MNNSKCGFVAIVGEPNSGKSTLVNAIVGEKISIVSPKAQTTRRQIRGIAQYEDEQIIFVDTPGFFRARTSLEKVLVRNFRHSYEDSDIILVMVDATSSFLSMTFSFIEKLESIEVESKQKIIVAINKVDKAKKDNILKIAKKLSDYKFINEVFMISALNNDGVQSVVNYLKNNIPDGPFLYETDRKTDMDMVFRLAEITRENVYKILSEELPYSIYIETELFKETDKKVRIFQAIVVMRDSQKGIVIGAKGERIKRIKDLSIRDMKELLNKKVELRLFVKVKEKWADSKTHLQNAGIL
ncbi:MAG: GTPase Era [Holosporales bacterium]|jgi:GTP-binding protein Era|nr:GTPase Era [Holosporales bacterium]